MLCFSGLVGFTSTFCSIAHEIIQFPYKKCTWEGSESADWHLKGTLVFLPVGVKIDIKHNYLGRTNTSIGYQYRYQGWVLYLYT